MLSSTSPIYKELVIKTINTTVIPPSTILMILNKGLRSHRWNSPEWMVPVDTVITSCDIIATTVSLPSAPLCRLCLRTALEPFYPKFYFLLAFTTIQDGWKVKMSARERRIPRRLSQTCLPNDR